MFRRKVFDITATVLFVLFSAFAFAYPPGPAAEGSDAGKGL